MSWIDRDDVNAVLFIVLFGLVILALTAVPPEWYGPAASVAP